VWTLVAISVERYYAICHPLRSRRWQTLSHAYRLIAAVWFGSLLLMTPVAALSELQPTSQGAYL
jgi:cholecystokinin A receptor